MMGRPSSSRGKAMKSGSDSRPPALRRTSSSHCERNRLLADSVVMTDNLVTVIEKAIDRPWGRVDNMGPVDDALRHTLNL